MARKIIAEVSQNALRHNLDQIRKFAPHSKIIAMVKANAYGHGLRLVAKTLSGSVDALGVASIEEALKLRENGITDPIVLMEGFFHEDELPLVQEQNLTLVVHHQLQAKVLTHYAGKLQQKFKIWLKVNTGMNRLGFAENNFEKAYPLLCQDKKIDIIGFMTHFSKADETQSPMTAAQCEEFARLVADKKGERCLANSAGILAWPQSHCHWVRPGLILYGAAPFADKIGTDFNLLPAMTVRSEIIAIREVREGEQVGYGGTWENQSKISKIGIVAMGYGDGYPWHAKNGTPVLVNGQRTGTVGRVSMDMLAVDITGLDNVNVGSPVTLWGDHLPIEEVARHAGTIPYELFCRFTERVTMQAV